MDHYYWIALAGLGIFSLVQWSKAKEFEEEVERWRENAREKDEREKNKEVRFPVKSLDDVGDALRGFERRMDNQVVVSQANLLLQTELFRFLLRDKKDHTEFGNDMEAIIKSLSNEPTNSRIVSELRDLQKKLGYPR